jgi:3-isopropylmalate dehydratase small subunit
MAIKAAGIQAVVARSFARIFYRNAINIGLPVIQCDAIYDAVKDGDPVSIDIHSGAIDADGKMFQGETPGPVAAAIMEAGTLIDLIKTRGWAAIEEVS